MDVVDAIDDAEISGSIIILLQEGLAFVKRHSRKMWQKTADGRLEMPDYPERAVLEGIVNAIIHRNYNEIGLKYTHQAECLTVQRFRTET